MIVFSRCSSMQSRGSLFMQVCSNCGSSEIEDDATQGNAVCVACGTVQANLTAGA